MDTRQLTRAERRKIQTYDTLKQSAMMLFMARGYDQLTIKAITDHADLGYGTFYLHFESKDDIVWAVLEEWLEVETEATNQRVLHLEHPVREYVSWIYYFEDLRERGEMFIMLFGKNGSATLYQNMIDYLARLHKRNLNAGTYSFGQAVQPDVSFMAQFAAGAMMNLTLWWLESDNDHSAQEMADAMFRMYYRTDPPKLSE